MAPALQAQVGQNTAAAGGPRRSMRVASASMPMWGCCLARSGYDPAPTEYGGAHSPKGSLHAERLPTECTSASASGTEQQALPADLFNAYCATNSHYSASRIPDLCHPFSYHCFSGVARQGEATSTRRSSHMGATTRPRNSSESELRKVGMEHVGCVGNALLRCMECGQVWSPNLLPDGGRLPKRYWRCPNGCNAEPQEPR